MRIAMLSWRYAGHPQAGGAETVTHEVLRRFVAAGDRVTCFTAAYPGAPMHDELDGVRLVRRGLQWTVHVQAYRWLRSRLHEFDRVVDQINTIPFLTPLYVDEGRRRMFVHQMAREYWWRETRGAFKLVAPVGYAVEPLQYRLYRTTATITVSDSTRDDLVRFGVPAERVHVVRNAVSLPPVPRLEPKDARLRLIVVGRLTPAKFVEEAIAAFALVQAAVPDAALDIVGGGDPSYRERLEALVRERGLAHVTFHGRVSEEDKLALIDAARFHVFCSHREGWGLTVGEAAVRGTPSVGFDVPGVRDSIADPRLLAPRGDVGALAERVLRAHRDADAYEDLRAAAWERARGHTWDDTARQFAEALR